VSPIRLERNSGPATARNRGWRAARAALIAFTDDDCAADPAWVARMARALERAEVVQGRTVPDQLQRRGSGRFMYTIKVEVEQEVGYYECCNMGYRREVLEALDGFDESFRYTAGTPKSVGPIYGEDVDLAWRAKGRGFDIAFAADAIVYHEVRYLGFADYLLDMRRREGIPLAIRRNPELRERCYHHWFWVRSHPRALVAGGGLALMTRRGVVPKLAGAALTIPYIRFRTRFVPVGERSEWPVTIPLALIADLVEVAVLAVGSIKHRTLVL
jgi:GT2 family glycosyltransferase